MKKRDKMAERYLWQRVAVKIRRKITGGQWPKGMIIPTEFELSAMFGVSRATVRKALSQLSKRGYVQAKPHVGTRVTFDAGDAFYTEIGGIRAIDEYGNTFPRQVLETDVIEAGESEAKFFGLTQGRRYTVLRNVRSARGTKLEAVVYTCVYVDAAVRGIVEKAKANPDELAVTLVEAITGRRCTCVRQTVHACTMPPAAAELFDADPMTPTLRIVRNYYDAEGANLVVSDSYHPGGRYAFSFTKRFSIDCTDWSHMLIE